VADDLRLADIYFSVSGTARSEKRPKPDYSAKVRRDSVSHCGCAIPDIMLPLRQSVEYGSHIESLLRQIHETDSVDARKR